MKKTVNQSEMNFDPIAGQQLAQTGASRAADHAERDNPNWKNDALQLVIEFSHTKPDGFMCEDVRAFAYKRGFPKPPEERAWGQIIITARKLGHIVSCGMAKAKDRKVHASINTVWKPR